MLSTISGTIDDGEIFFGDKVNLIPYRWVSIDPSTEGPTTSTFTNDFDSEPASALIRSNWPIGCSSDSSLRYKPEKTRKPLRDANEAPNLANPVTLTLDVDKAR